MVQQKYPDLNFQAVLMQNIRKLILSPWTEQEIDLLTVDKSLYFVKPRTITVNYLKTIATLDNFVGTQVSKVIVKWFNLISSLEILSIYLHVFFTSRNLFSPCLPKKLNCRD